MNKILLIGCGHMGSSLLRAWHKKTSDHFTIIDPKQYNKLNRTYKTKVLAFDNIDNWMWAYGICSFKHLA